MTQKVDTEPKILELFRHVTNGAECFSFAVFFSSFTIIMFWQMQIFRRVFRLKQDKCIVDPKKIVHVHSLILIYLIGKLKSLIIVKIIAYLYGLISGQMDYTNKQNLQPGELLKVSCFNPMIYGVLLNLSTFSQVTAYILTIRNWLWIIEGLVDEEYRLPLFFTKLSIPLLVSTFLLQIIFIILLLLRDDFYIHSVALMVIMFHILLVNFMSISSWTIYKFFKSFYTDSQQLIRAIIFVNVGLQIQAIMNIVYLTCPAMIMDLKTYNKVTKVDTTVNWAIIWSFEQFFGQILPTIFIITLARPVLFLFYRTSSQQNQRILFHCILSIQIILINIIQEQVIKNNQFRERRFSSTSITEQSESTTSCPKKVRVF